MELEGFVGGADFFVEFSEAGQDVLLQRLQLCEIFYCVGGGVEVVEVAEEEAEGVTQLAVVVADAAA